MNSRRGQTASHITRRPSWDVEQGGGTCSSAPAARRGTRSVTQRPSSQLGQRVRGTRSSAPTWPSIRARRVPAGTMIDRFEVTRDRPRDRSAVDWPPCVWPLWWTRRGVDQGLRPHDQPGVAYRSPGQALAKLAPDSTPARNVSNMRSAIREETVKLTRESMWCARCRATRRPYHVVRSISLRCGW